MSTYPNIDLGDYYFADEGSVGDRLGQWAQRLANPMSPLGDYIPTFLIRRKKTIWQLQVHGFQVAARILGLFDAEMEPLLKQHHKRLTIFIALLILLYFLIVMVLAFPFFYAYIGIYFVLRSLLSVNIDPVITALLFFIPLFYLYRTAGRISILMLERKFADTLCVMQITYILILLTRDDVLHKRKADLLHRMNFLANKLILMGMNYTGSDIVNKKWAYDYFRKISRFVRERERLIIAPTEDTLDQLRKDMLYLGNILASGKYGAFDFQVSEVEKDEQKPRSLLERVLAVSIGIGSVAIPILVISFMIVSPEGFNQLNINRDTVFYISIAWLLLALDKLFGMGIVESFLSLLKATKELR